MNCRSFLQVAAVCICATTMFLSCGNLFAGIIYTDNFESGYSSGAIIGQNGWLDGTGADFDGASATLFEHATSPSSDHCLKVIGSDSKWGAVYKDVVDGDSEITDSLVEVYVDMWAGGQYKVFAAGSAAMTMNSTNSGVAAMFGFQSPVDGQFRVYNGNAMINPYPTGCSENTHYTFHAILDLNNKTYQLEILKASDGSSVIGFDGWLGDADSDPDNLGFRDDTVTSFQNIGVASYSKNTSAFVDNISISATPVPEPSTVAMLLAGLTALGVVIRKRK